MTYVFSVWYKSEKVGIAFLERVTVEAESFRDAKLKARRDILEHIIIEEDAK